MTHKLLQLFEALNGFVFFYPLLMSYLWVIGGIIFFFRRERGALRPPDLESYPPFSILVPCHNEESQIQETMGRLLVLDYPEYEIIAIDDGSSDNTPGILREFALKYERIRAIFINQNKGKAAALNAGAVAAKHEYLLTMDADTLLDAHALTFFAWHFLKYSRVGAVTGNPRIRNRTSLLAKIQLGEYSTIIGLIKRTQRLLGKILTVSGVLAAFRKQALLSVHFFDVDTVTEDIDVTWKLEQRFWDVRYEPRAICWVLVPEKIRGLWRQRVRWAQGGVEVLRKHRSIWADRRQRRLWPIYIEYIASVIWAYCFWGLVLLWGISLGFSLELPFGLLPPLPPAWTGSVLVATSVIMFITSIILDRRYDRNMLRYLFWVIWYPLVYWMIISMTVVFATPKALFKRKGKPAVWRSPDRGL